MNATITVVCYKSKTLKNGESPIMLRICKDNKKKYQSLGIQKEYTATTLIIKQEKRNVPRNLNILLKNLK